MSFEDSITESGPGFVGTKFCREWFDKKKNSENINCLLIPFI